MFPICDARGKVIAFGGRVLDDSKPKYINSPENVVYSKGRNLFRIKRSKKSRKHQRNSNSRGIYGCNITSPKRNYKCSSTTSEQH